MEELASADFAFAVEAEVAEGAAVEVENAAEAEWLEWIVMELMMNGSFPLPVAVSEL